MLDKETFLLVSEHGFLLQLEKGGISRCPQYAGMYVCALSKKKIDDMEKLPKQCPLNNNDPSKICPIVWILTCSIEGMLSHEDALKIMDSRLSLDDFHVGSNFTGEAPPITEEFNEQMDMLLELERSIEAKQNELKSLDEKGVVLDSSDIEKEKAKIDILKTELQNKLQEVESREKLVEKEEKELEKRKNDMEKSLLDKKAELERTLMEKKKQMENALTKKKKELEKEVEKNRDEKMAELAKLEKDLSKRENAVEAREVELDNTMTDKVKKLDDREKELSDREKAITEREDSIKTPDGEELRALEELEKQLIEREMAIKEREDDIDKKSKHAKEQTEKALRLCLLYTSPSPRDRTRTRMPSSA